MSAPMSDRELASGRSTGQIVPQIAVQNEIQSFSREVRANFAAPIFDPLSSSAPCYPLNTIFKYPDFYLGSGSFGYCYKIFSIIVGLSVFKENNTVFLTGSEEKMRRREFDAIFRLNHHPNVVSFFGYVTDKNKETGLEHPIGILMEFMAGGDIDQYVSKLHASKPDEFPLPPVLQNTWAKQIALGLNFIHSRNVMHRDIKPNNILLSHDRRVAKIAGFGLSKNWEKEPENHTRKIGHWIYSAPEIYTGEDYDKSVDVYSYAMVLYFIYYQRHPFDPKKNTYTYQKQIKGDSNTPPLRPALLTPSLPIDELIAKCWPSESNQRMTMPQVIEVLFSNTGQQLLPALNEIQSFPEEVRANFAAPIFDPLSSSAPCYPLNTIFKYPNSYLGSGSFGICCKVFNTIVGLSAFKQENQAIITSLQATEEEKMRRREFDAIFRLNHHPNVVSFFGYVTDKNKETGLEHPIGILMEFMAGGDIDQCNF